MFSLFESDYGLCGKSGDAQNKATNEGGKKTFDHNVVILIR